MLAPSGKRPALLLPGLALNILIGSGAFLVSKETLREIPPFTLAFLRFVLAAAVLWPIVRALEPEARIERRDRGRLLILGILAVPLNQGFFLVGMQWASASHGALLYALLPAFVLLFGLLAGGPRPTGGQLAGIAIAFIGVATLLLQRGLHFDPASLRGDLLVSAAVMSWAMFFVLGRKVIRRYGALVVTAEALLLGTIVYLPIGIIATMGFEPRAVSLQAWAGVLYLALLTSAVNYVLLFWGIQYLKPTTVSLVTNVQPVVTAALAWVFLKERFAPGFFVSAALVLAGIWLTQMRVRPPERDAEGLPT